MNLRALASIGAMAVLLAAAWLLTRSADPVEGTDPGRGPGPAVSGQRQVPALAGELRGEERAAVLTETAAPPAATGPGRAVVFETSAGQPLPEGTRVRWDGDEGPGVPVDLHGAARLSEPAPDGARIQLLGPRVTARVGALLRDAPDRARAIDVMEFKGWGALHRTRIEPWELRGTVVAGAARQDLGGQVVALSASRLSGFGEHQLRLGTGGRFALRCWVPGGSLTDISVLHVERKAGAESEVLEANAPLDLFRRPVRGLAELGVIELGEPPAPPGSGTRGERRRGAIHATVEVPGSVPVSQIQLRAIGPDTPPQGRALHWSKKRAALYGLTPGSYDVTLSVGGRELRRVRGVQVSSGRITSDPRLNPIAPGASLDTIRITPTFAPDARARSNPRLDVRGPDGWEQVLAVETRPRRSFRVAVHDAVDVRVSAEGCRTAYVSGVAADREVELGPGIPVNLDVVNLPTFHGDPRWQLVLTHRASGLTVDIELEGSRARFAAGETGTYDAVLRYARHGNWLFLREGATIGQLEIDEGAPEVTVTVPPDFMDAAR